jgi:hypothetical protein
MRSNQWPVGRSRQRDFSGPARRGRGHSPFSGSYHGACVISFLLASAAPIVSAQGLEVDWKLYGGASFGGQSLCFYDQKGLTRQPDGHIRIWTKCISKTELEDALNDPDKKIVEATAQKVIQGYVPPVLKLPQTNATDATVIIEYEEVADLGAVQPQSRIFYELNCPDRMLRELSLDLNINGRVGSKHKPADWKYIPPETNGAALLKLLCP